MTEKTRLDLRLVELGLANSRQKAQALIRAGDVLVDGLSKIKPDHLIGSDQILSLKQKERYVSRGGIKLEGALADLGVDPSGKEVLDVGASTGGFTDCLLQHGASRVTAVDVGYGQIAQLLRNDPRVTISERTNARYLQPSQFPRPFDMATVDVSFISLEKIIPTILPLLRPGGEILALIKPQFEAGKGQTKKGVVRDPHVHEAVIAKIKKMFSDLGCVNLKVAVSQLPGPKGNQEFFILATRP